MALAKGTTKKISEWRPSAPEFSHLWWRPSFGLWFGAAAGEGDEEGGEGAGVLGSFDIMFGLLAGFTAGFGKKWGLYSGLMGAIAIIPLLGMGFIGVPIGFHWRKKFGIGLIIPVKEVNPVIAIVAGVVLFTIPLLLKD